jgi:hypothetical protein
MARPLTVFAFTVLVIAAFIYYLSAQVLGNNRIDSADNNNGCTAIGHLNHGFYASGTRPRTPVKLVVKDDWLVNDDTLGGCTQIEPDIAISKTGYVLTWTDYRNGHDPDVFACQYDFSGTPTMSAIKVNDDTGGYYQGEPSVDTDSTGHFVVVWEDSRNRDKDIYGQRYDVNAIPTGSNFQVNDDFGSGKLQYTPDIAMQANGSFMITWRDDRIQAPDIYGQPYDASGLPVGSNFIVNDDSLPTVSQVSPRISGAPNNEFLVVWLDTRPARGIYGQRYSGSGSIIDTNFRISDNPGTSVSMMFPSVSSDGQSKTVVAWRDHREHGSYPNIYVQVYSSLFDTLGANFRANDSATNVYQDVPYVTVDSSGGFTVVWRDGRNDRNNPDIYGQTYDTANNPQGANFKINEFLPATHPVVAADPERNILAVWEDNSGEDMELSGQRYTGTGVPAGNNFSLTLDDGMSDQETCEIAMNTDGKFVIVWEDNRNSPQGVFAQRYDADGNTIGSNWQVSDTGTGGIRPSVAINSEGDFVIAWAALNSSHIYARKYLNTGVPLSAEFQVDSGITPATLEPSVAMMDDIGGFVVVWQDYRNDSKFSDIYAQRYSAQCVRLDTNFMVNQYSYETSESPCITMNNDGEFVVVWQEGVGGQTYYDIHGQRFASDGSTAGVNFQVSDAPMPHHQQTRVSAAIGNDDHFVVIWEDTREHTDYFCDIFAQVYDTAGLPVNANFRVNDNSGSSQRELASVTLHNVSGEFMTVWTDYTEANPQITARKFDISGMPLTSDLKINNPDLHLCNYHISSSRSIASNNERIAIAWTDNRRLKGWDICAKLVDWTYTSKEELHKYPGPSVHTYPNPVVQNLTIKYNLPANALTHYSPHITIYDRTGRIADRLYLSRAHSGTNTTCIDVSHLKSGIYFVKLGTPLMTPVTEKITILH